MKPVTKVLAAAIVGTGVLALSSPAALADFACSGDVCWHVHERYHYPPKARVIIHPDNWRHGPKVVIREHEGRGYWHRHHWVEFH